MSIGLDLGSTQFRSLRPMGNRLVGRACRLISLRIDDTPLHRKMLARQSAHFVDMRDFLMVLGDAALEWARLLQCPVTALMPDGQLPHDDFATRQCLSWILEGVLPRASHPRETCCLTIPGQLMPMADAPEQRFFEQLVRRRGYEPEIVGQSEAVMLAELGDSAYCGLAINLGATQCDFSLARSGRELARCSIPWGAAELIDADERPPEDEPECDPQAIADFLVEVLLEAGSRIEQHHAFGVLKQPVAIVCAGGITAASGFDAIFRRAWNRAAWPIQISSLQVASDPTYTVARGCLIQSLLATDAIMIKAA